MRARRIARASAILGSRGSPFDGPAPRKERLLDAEPPRIVLEHSERCADADRAAEVLQRALSPSRAPGRGWVVTMRVDESSAQVEGDIADSAGTAVGRRTLPRRNGECSAAARAMGVWASLVLDSRTQSGDPESASSAPSTSPVLGAAPSSASSATAPVDNPPWPAPEEAEKPPPEADWYIHHDDGRSLELGAGAFLLAGTVGGALLGPTAFALIEVGHGVFLRPSLALGETVTSIPTSGPRSTWTASRFDACLRLPGFYSHRQGLQLEGCAGADLGLSWLDTAAQQTVPYSDLGPSLDLRGELGSLAVVLRGLFGVNVVRPSFTDAAGAQEQPPLWSGRLELAFSWSVR